MVDSDAVDILYATDLGRNLIGGKREKIVDDVLNGDKKDKRKLRKTLALCMAFLCLGLCLTILGPTLLSLQQHLHTTLPKISWVFAGRSIGYLFGAILGGMVFESFNPLFLLAVCLLLCGIGIVIAPYVTTVMFLAICISSVAIGMGVLDTGANLLCLRMWGKKRSGTMLQALHFSFALGAFIAPLVAAPFLVETNSSMLAGGNASPTPLQNSTLALTDVNQTLGVADGVWTSHGKNDNIGGGDDKTGGLGGKKADGSKGDKSNSRMKRFSATPGKRESLTNKTAGEDNQETTLKNGSTTTTSGSTTTTGASSTTTVGSTTTTGASTTTTRGKSTTTGGSSTTTGASTIATRGSSTAMGGKSTMTGGSSTTTGASTTTARGSSTTTGIIAVAGASTTETTVSVTTSPSPPRRQVVRFAIAYIIIGVLVLVNSGVFFYFLCTKPKHEPQYTGSDQANDTSNKNSFPFRTRILILLFFFYFLYVGGEVAYGSFVSVFASKSRHHFEQDRASHVAAVFWGIFSLGRGLAICLASVISPLKMVIMDMVGCVATSLALTLFADRNENVLWIGSALLGLSMASLFPSGIAWLESYTPVTGNTASFLIVGSALGEMCVPVVIGYLFNQSIPGPMVLMYWMLATSGLSLFIFIYVMWLVMENGQEKKSLPAEKSPALELFQSVEEALPMEELFKNSGSNGKQMGKARIPPILKKKDHKE